MGKQDDCYYEFVREVESKPGRLEFVGIENVLEEMRRVDRPLLVPGENYPLSLIRAQLLVMFLKAKGFQITGRSKLHSSWQIGDKRKEIRTITYDPLKTKGIKAAILNIPPGVEMPIGPDMEIIHAS